MEMPYKFLCNVAVVHFRDQSRISKTCMVSGVLWSVKLVLQTKTQKSYICVRPWLLITILNIFQTGVDKHNGILMFLVLLVPEKIILSSKNRLWNTYFLMLTCFV